MSLTTKQFRDSLSNEMFLRSFRKFCLSEFSVENLLFWLDVEVFRSLPPADLPSQAKRIYDTYLCKDAVTQVNVPRLQKITYESAPPSVFDEQQAVAFRNMYNDALPRFLKSPVYAEVAAFREKEPAKYEACVLRDFKPYIGQTLAN